MKKSLLLLVLLLLTKVASAHDFEVDGIYYNIINENEVAVTYQGKNPSEYYDEYTGYVNIPSFVTYNSKTYCVSSIGSKAFHGCNSLTSIEIGNPVTSIGDWAFGYPVGITARTSRWLFINCLAVLLFCVVGGFLEGEVICVLIFGRYFCLLMLLFVAQRLMVFPMSISAMS